MNHDLATKPATWEEILQCPAQVYRLTATADITGLPRIRSVTGAIVDLIGRAADEIGKCRGSHIDAVAESTGSTEKLARDFRDAVMRDFIKTQVRAPINAALAKLADALAPHMGLGVDGASDVLRDAAKSIEAGQRFAESGQVAFVPGVVAGSAANVGPAIQKILNERKAGKRY